MPQHPVSSLGAHSWRYPFHPGQVAAGPTAPDGVSEGARLPWDSTAGHRVAPLRGSISTRPAAWQELALKWASLCCPQQGPGFGGLCCDSYWGCHTLHPASSPVTVPLEPPRRLSQMVRAEELPALQPGNHTATSCSGPHPKGATFLVTGKRVRAIAPCVVRTVRSAGHATPSFQG